MHLQRHVVIPATSRTACQRQLSVDIEVCLSGYESSMTSFQGLRRPTTLARRR